MSELRIQGYKTVYDLLSALQPYIRFKNVQCEALMHACELLQSTKLKDMTRDNLKKIVSYIVIIQNANYDSKKRKTKEELYTQLGLTP